MSPAPPPPFFRRPQDRDKFPDFSSLWHSMASMYAFMLAMFDMNVFYNSTNPTAAMVGAAGRGGGGAPPPRILPLGVAQAPGSNRARTGRGLAACSSSRAA